MKRDYTNPMWDALYAELLEDQGKIPFHFTYNNKTYHGFSSGDLNLLKKTVCNKNGKQEATFCYDLLGELTGVLLLAHYPSHGATEWTVWFENNGTENSKVLEDVKSAVEFCGKRPTLKGILGDSVNQYQPYSLDLEGMDVSYSSDSGRATHINFPYFNLEYGEGGAMLAIGWAGTWNARFTSDGEKTVYTASSVNNLKTYLKPGEKIRTALFVIAPYTVRNEQYATNYWRSWYMAHNIPKQDSTGREIEPFSSCCLASDTGLPNSDGSISERYSTWRPSLEKMFKEDCKVDVRWFDAGWYVRPDGRSEETNWWGTVGTWELDPVKWPGKTFRESTDFTRDHGMRTIVWFEPERVTDPENLAKNFGYDLRWAIRVEGEPVISNNIGDPECLKWTTERICKMLRENHVDIYREDNNCNAGKLWRHLDGIEGENRSGITECKFIDAHYKMWDDIIKCTLSYGGCGFVDSCASGGGRNDLESMRRGVPLLRSDTDRTNTALRLSMTTAFNKWIPFCGANTKEKKTQLALTGDSDVYIWRASYLASLNVDSQFVQDPDQDFSILRFGLNEWKKVRPYLLKEFYTLTPWHKEYDNTSFTAFCYFDPDKEEGVLFAFRQECCPLDTLNLSLPFAKDCGDFVLRDEDSGKEIESMGSLSIQFEEPRCAKLFWIKKL